MTVGSAASGAGSRATRGVGGAAGDAGDPASVLAGIEAELSRRADLPRQKRACEEDLLEFVRTFWSIVEPETPLVEGWPIEALCDVLMAVADGHIKRLIINIFPGAMKSFMVDVFLPAWLWGPRGRSATRFICASRQIYLTERDNLRFQRIVSSDLYQKFWGDRVRLDLVGVSNITNKETGWKLATSIGGITGARGDYILIDDPNSTDPNEIESEAVTRRLEGYLREVMPDRLNSLKDGVIILVQQRTGENDATAVLAKYGTGYVWLMVPMEFDPLRISQVVLRRDENGEPVDVWIDPRALDPDTGEMLEGLTTDADGKPSVRPGSPMDRATGALAWPARFPAEQVEEQRRIKGPWAWQSQYNQMPSVRGGEIIRRDWWKLWPGNNYPEVGTVVVSLDTAVEQGEMNDSNALTVWGAFAGQQGEPCLILLWAWQDKLPLAQLVARVAEISEKWKADYLVIEHKTRGRDVHDEIKRLYATARWTTVLWPPKGEKMGDKMSRLQAVSVLFSGDVKKVPAGANADGTQRYMDVWSGGMIYAPNTTWADEVIDQVSAFPRGAHDDYVDSTSMALNFLRRTGVVLRKVEYLEREEESLKFRPAQGVPYAIR